MGNNCYPFKLLALDGAMMGAVVNASDVFLPAYSDVTSWQIITGGIAGEIITMSQAQIDYEGYIGSCPPLPQQYFEFVLTVPTNANPILHHNGVVNLVIDWGDGGITTTTNGAISPYVYVAGGTYTVKAYGSFSGAPDSFLSFYDEFNGVGIDGLVSVGAIKGITGLTSAKNMFNACPNLTTIVADLFAYCPNITTFEKTFMDCGALSAIFGSMFNNNTLATSFSETFSYCTSIPSIPSGLFDFNVLATDFLGTFRGLTVTNIPAGLFDNNTSASVFQGTFSDNSSLTTIPALLLYQFGNNINYAIMFRNCYLLAAIPSNLFNLAIIGAANDFSATFNGCVALTGNAPALWTTPATSHASCFLGDTGLTNYATIPAGWK